VLPVSHQKAAPMELGITGRQPAQVRVLHDQHQIGLTQQFQVTLARTMGAEIGTCLFQQFQHDWVRPAPSERGNTSRVDIDIGVVLELEPQQTFRQWAAADIGGAQHKDVAKHVASESNLDGTHRAQRFLARRLHRYVARQCHAHAAMTAYFGFAEQTQRRIRLGQRGFKPTKTDPV
jgi:hypothetical protein